jgi:hypothetical protein
LGKFLFSSLKTFRPYAYFESHCAQVIVSHDNSQIIRLLGMVFIEVVPIWPTVKILDAQPLNEHLLAKISQLGLQSPEIYQKIIIKSRKYESFAVCSSVWLLERPQSDFIKPDDLISYDWKRLL